MIVSFSAFQPRATTKCSRRGCKEPGLIVQGEDDCACALLTHNSQAEDPEEKPVQHHGHVLPVLLHLHWVAITEPEFLTFREPRNPLQVIDSARLHRLTESVHWNRFLGFLNVYKFGLGGVWWDIVVCRWDRVLYLYRTLHDPIILVQKFLPFNLLISKRCKL
jgi:hypothetical protein